MSQQGIHYFPGHMKKALKDIRPYLKVVDFILEVVDARAPKSSSNPILADMANGKPHLVCLSKSDYADPEMTKKWMAYFENKGERAFSINLKKTSVLETLKKVAAPLIKVKRDKEAKIGMMKQPLRIMVIGVPNVGKSTFINNLGGKKIAIVGNKAGVTRSEQWIKISEDFLLLDTPGVLPMNYLDAAEAIRLAILGSMKEEVLPSEELAVALIGYLKQNYPASLQKRFQIEDISNLDSSFILESIAKRRGLLDGDKPSSEKASYLLIKEFKDGLLGRYSLEEPLC